MPLLADSMRQFALALIVAAIIVAMLVLGKSVLVPLAGAIIFTFMLTPIIRWLVQWGFPRGLAVGSLVATIVGFILALALLFSTEMLSLTGKLDDYRDNVVTKIRSVASVGQGDGVIGKAAQAVDRIAESITQEVTPAQSHGAGASESAQPIEVRNVGENRNLLARLESVVEPMAGIGLAFIFTLFLLMQYEDLRDRVVRILGTDHLSDTTSAMNEAGTRLSRLFLAQAALNTAYGILVGIVLWALGVPGAFVWAVLSGAMRFVPFIGSFIAAAPPVALAAGVSPGWEIFIVTIVFFVSSELIIGNFVEPLVIGRHVGLSAFAMIAAASFWTLLWGPVGLLLAAPITIVTVIIGRYLPGLAFLSVLLGDEPALSGQESVYQRLLAGDAAAVAEHLEGGEGANRWAAAADAVVLPALKLASVDRDRENLSDQQTTLIRETLLEAVSLAIDDAPEDEEHKLDEAGVVVVGARGMIDAIASAYLGRLLTAEAGRAVFAPSRESGLTALSAVRATMSDVAPGAVVVIATGSTSRRQIEYVVRRACALFPSSRLILFWPVSTNQRVSATGSEDVKSSDTVVVRTAAELIALLKVRAAEEPVLSGAPERSAQTGPLETQA